MNFIEFCNKYRIPRDKTLDILNSENVSFTIKDFYENMGYFRVKMTLNGKDEIKSALMSPFALFLPDFILDRISYIDSEKKELILNFLGIFITKLIYLNYKNFYTIRDAEYLKPKLFFKNDRQVLYNRKNLEYYFGLFFQNKVTIVENFPKLLMNKNPFVLGKSSINSNLLNTPPIGRRVISRFETVLVQVKVLKEEEAIFLNFLKVIKRKNLSFLKMSRPFIYAIFSLNKGQFVGAYSLKSPINPDEP
jgi:hypothetical protein